MTAKKKTTKKTAKKKSTARRSKPLPLTPAPRALVWMSKDLICDPRDAAPVVGRTLAEAREFCKQLGGRLASDEDFNVLGDRELYSSRRGVWSWCEGKDNLRAGGVTDDWSPTSQASARGGTHQVDRSALIGFRCVWETRTAVPPDIEVIPVVPRKKLPGYLLKEPLKDQFGFYLRAMTYDEAEKMAQQLGAEIPSGQVYDALGDMKLESGLWCWSTEKDGEERVLRGGRWYDGDQEYLSAAGRAAIAPSGRYYGFGFRPFWTKKSAVPPQYVDSLIEVYEK